MLRFARLVSALALTPLAAHANPASIVPSAADPGNTADLHVRIDYSYEIDRSVIVREAVGEGDPTSPIARHGDLAFHQFRHVLVPRADLSVYHDTWLSVAVPIIITQQRELKLDDGVMRDDSSSTVRDGILPAEGFDARDPGTPLTGDLMFRGNNRKGIDQVHLGLNYAPMSQARDKTKPTWKLGGEFRLAAGKVMAFDAMDPRSNTAVGRGVHELRLWTSVARRLDRAEGWFDAYWQVPITAKKASLYQDPGFGATNTGVGQQGGVHFGVELYALDDKETGNTISLDLGGGLVGHFEGREYTEMWEVFALAGDSRTAGPLVLDSDPTDPELNAVSHPGITNVENHLETSTRAAIRARLGSHAAMTAGVDLAWKTDHLITFADAGVDLPSCSTGSTPCENDDNDVVDPDSREVNPLHAPIVDLVGHRYYSEDNFTFAFFVTGQLLF